MSDSRPPARPRFNARDIINVAGPFIGLALVLGLFSVAMGPDVRARFLTGENFGLVFAQTVIVALGTLGTTIIIISAGIDLSIGSVIALTSVVAALIIRSGQSPLLALVVAVLLGGAVGLVNGSLITGLRVTPFIVTLGTLGIARGVAQWLGHEETVNAPSTWLNKIAIPSQKIFGVPVSPSVWIALFLAILTAMMLRYTRFGRYVFAIGSNETAARLSGLRVDALKIAIYSLGGLFVGLAGVVQYAQLGQGDPTVAVGDELDVIAATVIGGASLMGGEGSILGSMLGALIMAFLRNGAVQMGWYSYVQEIIIGAVIIVAVALDQLRHRANARATNAASEPATARTIVQPSQQ